MSNEKKSEKKWWETDEDRPEGLVTGRNEYGATEVFNGFVTLKKDPYYGTWEEVDPRSNNNNS